MFEIVIVFIAGFCSGFSLRILYHMVTGRDIPIYKRKFEIKRLKKEIERLKVTED